MGKIISLIISIIYLVIAYIFGGLEMSFRVFLFLSLPLACIWFGDAMGSWVGFSELGGPRIARKSPGCLVRFMGWIVLLLFPVLIIIILIGLNGR